MASGTLISARTSEIGLGGCYVDALSPFPEGTLVGLRILRDQGIFETTARVAYCDPAFGMGLAFRDMTLDQRSLLEAWLTELVSHQAGFLASLLRLPRWSQWADATLSSKSNCWSFKG
jgi:PilZ domain